MTASTRRRSIPIGAEVALAFGVGAASFALVAVILAIAESDILVVALAAACVGAVIALERAVGIAHAVPAAMAALVAYDWYRFAPTHPEELPDAANLADLVVYLGVSVFVGELAALASRRAEVSEAASSRLAAEQTALRHVATRVARGVPPPEIFAAVANEVGVLLDVDAACVIRFDGEESKPLATWSADGSGSPGITEPQACGIGDEIRKTGRAVRIDDVGSLDPAPGEQRRIRSAVGAPIFVDGRLWGAMVAWSTRSSPLAQTAEGRLSDFTELLATAISNTASREELARLADEQAALRRVATLVARDVPHDEVFGAVTEEAGRLLGADLAGLLRYETDATVTPVAAWAAAGCEYPPLPDRWATVEGDPPTVVAMTRRATRIDDWTGVPGPIAAYIRDAGVSSSVGGPILVEGRLWGALAVHTKEPQPLPPDTESRLANFTELVATAISNSEARSDLAASRARIVAMADEERRRVVRDLHDGAQQRLVHTVVTLKLARSALHGEVEQDATDLLTAALDHAERATEELRELAHGILPAVLMHGGLRAGVDSLAARMTVPVENDVSVGRLPAPVEATAYFVVAEALTNVVKHAHADHAAVAARVEDGTLRVDVRDDGVGGVRRDGSGLTGLADRLAAVDGRLQVESPADGGTLVAAAIPLAEK